MRQSSKCGWIWNRNTIKIIIWRIKKIFILTGLTTEQYRQLCVVSQWFTFMHSLAVWLTYNNNNKKKAMLYCPKPFFVWGLQEGCSLGARLKIPSVMNAWWNTRVSCGNSTRPVGVSAAFSVSSVHFSCSYTWYYALACNLKNVVCFYALNTNINIWPRQHYRAGYFILQDVSWRRLR